MPAARKRPTQQRSRETVERIIDGATRVLTEGGYQQASTNRIAAEAGVSPGSVYQYFTDKDEIVAAVIGRVVDGFGESVSPALRLAASQPPAQATRTVLEAVLGHLEPRAKLLDAFVDRVPADHYPEAFAGLRRRVSDITFQLLAGHRDALRHQDLERMTWLAVTITQNLTVRYVLDQPPIARDDFLDDLTAIVLRLATPGAPGLGTATAAEPATAPEA